jgi:hypothetical protein
MREEIKPWLNNKTEKKSKAILCHTLVILQVGFESAVVNNTFEFPLTLRDRPIERKKG